MHLKDASVQLDARIIGFVDGENNKHHAQRAVNAPTVGILSHNHITTTRDSARKTLK